VTTQITQSGINIAINAINGNGPKINLNQFKIGPTIITPVKNDPSTDISDAIYTSSTSPSTMQYAVVDKNTIEYIVTLDESMGPFPVGRIGMFHDNGNGTHTLFSITALDISQPDPKYPTAGNTVGNRLTYSIYLAISNMADFTIFTIQLLHIVSVPEANDENSLPDPLHVAFNTSQVLKHTLMRIPALAFRETPSMGGMNPPAWLMRPESLIPGKGEGIIPIDTSACDASATIGTIIALDYTNGIYTRGDPAINLHIVGIRTGKEEITNYGPIVLPGNYSPLQRLYAGTGSLAGQVTTTVGKWYVGHTMRPVSTQNATGYLAWVDFTGLNLQEGPGAGIGPTGVQGPSGPSGAGGSGFAGIGQCYLKLVNGLLTLLPFNGNTIRINNVTGVIPSSGITLGPSGLIPNTNYYIYAYMSASGVTMEAVTTAPVISNTSGIKIKGPVDNTRTLVGLARTIDGPAWVDTDSQLFVLSWFNKRLKKSKSILPAGRHHPEGIYTGSPNYIELHTGGRNNFLIWGGFLADFHVTGYIGEKGSGGSSTAVAFDDGLNPEEGMQQGTSGTYSEWESFSINGMKTGLAEGDHYSTLLGLFNGTGGSRVWYKGYVQTLQHDYFADVGLIIQVEG